MAEVKTGSPIGHPGSSIRHRFNYFGASGGECGEGAAGITASASSQSLEKRPRPPNVAFTNPLRRNNGERARNPNIVAFAQGDVEPFLGNAFRSPRVLGNDGFDSCVNRCWVCALFQIDQCSRHPCVRIGRNQFERPIQNCSEVSVATLVFISEGQLLEEEEIARVQLQGALKIRRGFLPPTFSSIDETS